MLDLLRGPAKAVRAAWRRLRFRLWTLRLRARLKRCGARLIVEAPEGAHFDTPPAVRCSWEGEGERVLTLRIGKEVELGRHTTLEIWAWGTNVLEIGDRVRFHDGVRIQLRGGSLRIGERSEIRDVALLRAGGELTLGEEITVSHGVFLHCERRIDVGDLTGLAERVTVADSGHAVDGSDKNWRHQPLVTAPVTIGRNVTVFANAVVLHGARLGDNTAVAANAVVLGGEYPSSWLIAGAPAKPVKALARGESGSIGGPEA